VRIVERWRTEAEAAEAAEAGESPETGSDLDQRP
jgi:hypothetical protein